MSLAAKLQEQRRKKGQSLQKVADAVGVSKAHIWELEKGTSKNPGLELLGKLSEHFGVSVDFWVIDDVSVENATASKFFRDYGGELATEDWEILRSMAERLKENRP